jgi:hypothetical protein
MSYVRIPRALAVEPLEVLLNQRMGRIVETPQDLAAALHENANGIDTLEDILDSLIKKENA